MSNFGEYIKPFENATANEIAVNGFVKQAYDMAMNEPCEATQKTYWKHFNWMKKHLKEFDDMKKSGFCRCGMGAIEDVIDQGYEFGFECTYCR